MSSPFRILSTSLVVTLLVVLLAAFSTACAPKDISSDSSRLDREYYGKGGADALSDARYPIAGFSSKKDRYFYQMSQPSVMENVQQWRVTRFTRGHSAKANPEDPSYREVPRERSPFRQ